jgi:hypothetical protein
MSADEVRREIDTLRARIRDLEANLPTNTQLSTPNIRMEDLNVAGPITLEPVIGRVRREYELGDRIVQRKVDEVLFCRCGRRLDQTRVLRCQRCSQLVCEDCAVLYRRRVHCLWCFKQVHNWTKTDYKIFLCIASGITDTNNIFRITGVLPGTIRKSARKFRDVYVTRKASCFREFFFSVPRITDAGADALAVYDKLFGADYDSLFIKRKIKALEKTTELERLTRTLTRRG